MNPPQPGSPKPTGDSEITGDSETINAPTSTSCERTVRVLNPQGLHARPADLIVRAAGEYEAQVWLQKGSEKVDCRSILSLLTLGAAQGTELTLSADGCDADKATQIIGLLFDQGFNELDDENADPNAPASLHQN